MITITRTYDKSGELYFICTQTGSKRFSVKQYGSIYAAFIAARNFIDDYYVLHPEEKRKTINFWTIPIKRSKSGIAGVYRTSYKDREKLKNYWCANIPRTKTGSRNISKRFCIETHGEEKAKELAIKARKDWERTYIE